MNINEYQQVALTTANYPPISHSCIYPALGLANETGEVLGKLKKVWRDDNGVFTTEKLNSLFDELGDVLWYLSVLSHELGFKLEDIAEHNKNKLKSRQERGVINGNGDKR